jgi:hypothetical protein
LNSLQEQFEASDQQEDIAFIVLDKQKKFVSSCGSIGSTREELIVFSRLLLYNDVTEGSDQ